MPLKRSPMLPGTKCATPMTDRYASLISTSPVSAVSARPSKPRLSIQPSWISRLFLGSGRPYRGRFCLGEALNSERPNVYPVKITTQACRGGSL